MGCSLLGLGGAYHYGEKGLVVVFAVLCIKNPFPFEASPGLHGRKYHPGIPAGPAGSVHVVCSQDRGKLECCPGCF